MPAATSDLADALAQDIGYYPDEAMAVMQVPRALEVSYGKLDFTLMDEPPLQILRDSDEVLIHEELYAPRRYSIEEIQGLLNQDHSQKSAIRFKPQMGLAKLVFLADPFMKNNSVAGVTRFEIYYIQDGTIRYN